MSELDDEDLLKGLTLKVYRLALKKGKPVGVREVQRSLKLSSPTLAAYHLEKLENGGLLKKNADGYIVNRVYLRNLLRLRTMLIPRYFFHSIFFLSALIVQLFFLRPFVLSREYVFGIIVTCAAASSYIYETFRIFIKKTI
jgi:DNA-binding transcriptional ArsR family regulator